MKTAQGTPSSRAAPSREVTRLRVRLAEAEETIRAIRSGEADTIVIAGKHGPRVYTLEGAEQAYRVLIESMNEGALTLTVDKTILYANACFAQMVKCPLEQVTGSTFRRFLSAEDLAILRPLMKKTVKSGSKIQTMLNAGDGSQMPVQISIRPLAKNGSKVAAVSMVVTDMTEAHRAEELLRVLTNRVVQAQETERGRVALELHDGITQLLCAILFYSEALVKSLSTRDGPSKGKAVKLQEMAREAADEVERISHNLRPGVLENLGLAAAMRNTGTEFTGRTGVSVKLVDALLPARLPTDIELVFYRIFQEALGNVGKHARASHVTAHLTKQEDVVQLAIHDDGIGFDSNHRPTGRKGRNGIGLLGMRERTINLGGTFKVKSMRLAGTEIVVRIPLRRGKTKKQETSKKGSS